jgi:hypothetical protein
VNANPRGVGTALAEALILPRRGIVDVTVDLQAA